MRTLPGPAGNVSGERKSGKGKVERDSLVALSAMVSIAGFEEEWGGGPEYKWDTNKVPITWD